jgi:hypothetical protein
MDTINADHHGVEQAFYACGIAYEGSASAAEVLLCRIQHGLKMA